MNKKLTNNWIRGLQHVGSALLMAGIILMILGDLPKYLTPDTGWARQLVNVIIAHTLFIPIAGLVFMLPAAIPRIILLCQTANRIGWGAAFRAINKTPTYKPWPRHTDPIAHGISWGGLYPKDDVTYRATRIKLTGKYRAIQRVLNSRIVIVIFMFFVSLVVLSFPAWVNSLIYEIPPADIVALKEFTHDARALFYGTGLVICLLSISSASRTCITATFDKATNQCVIYKGRWFGWFFQDQISNINTSQIRGIQIIGYRADQARHNKRLVQQYEMNLVDRDRNRIHLCKHHRQNAMLDDSKRLASFLEIKVWDRSERYTPALYVEPDPLVQSL